MSSNTPKVGSDLFGTKEFTVTMSLRNADNTADSSLGVFQNTNAGGATITGNDTRSITFVGTQPEVNTAVSSTRFLPNADVQVNLSFNWSQTDDDGTGTPGSNPVDANLKLNIDQTHNEFSSLVTNLVYNEDEILTVNFGSITDVRGDTLPSTQYSVTLSFTEPMEDVRGWTNFSTTGVLANRIWTYTGTKNQVNTELASVEILHPAGQFIPFDITLTARNETDNISQFTQNISTALGATDVDFVLTDLDYSENGTPTLNVNIAEVTDKRSNSIKNDIIYQITIESAESNQISFQPTIDIIESITNQKQPNITNDGLYRFTVPVVQFELSRELIIEKLVNGVWTDFDTITTPEEISIVDFTPNGDTLFIGQPNADVVGDGTTNHGQILVYKMNNTGNGYGFNTNIRTPTPSAADLFGTNLKVSTDGSSLISISRDNIHYFEFSTSWTETQKIAIGQNDIKQSEIASDLNRILINFDNNDDDAGTADFNRVLFYNFSQSNNEYVLEQTLDFSSETSSPPSSFNTTWFYPDIIGDIANLDIFYRYNSGSLQTWTLLNGTYQLTNTLNYNELILEGTKTEVNQELTDLVVTIGNFPIGNTFNCSYEQTADGVSQGTGTITCTKV